MSSPDPLPPDPSPDQTQIVLRADHLVKRFGALTAVDQLSLEVRAGEVFGFLGPNGAGKTTSINMLCGLLAPDAGQVYIAGQPVHGGSRAAAWRVGVCPQEIIVWDNLTCLEQLVFIGEMYGLPGRLARQRSVALLQAVDLEAQRDQLAKTLSGGMQRRLNLILALVHDPEILVLDEPEAGLDPQSRLLVREYIQSLARHKTVILTTHNMDEADRLADRVAIIDHGRLLALDTPQALKRQVGQGDVLEIELNGLDAGELSGAQQALVHLVDEVSLADRTLLLRSLGLVERLPAILSALGQAGITTGEVRLRENSLEDVFIALTGRRLRI